MRRTRAFIGAAAAAMITTSALGAPAAAIDPPETTIVHGIPGVRVDLCIDGKEVKSGLRYGRKFQTALDNPEARIVLKPKRRGNCRGRTIARLRLESGLLGNRTVVARLKKGSPALQILQPTKVPPSAALLMTQVIIGNGTSFGTVDAWIATDTLTAAPTPRFPGLVKGGFYVGQLPHEGTVVNWFSRPGKTTPLLLPAVQQIATGESNHFVLVGTKVRNLRIVRFRTNIQEM